MYIMYNYSFDFLLREIDHFNFIPSLIFHRSGNNLSSLSRISSQENLSSVFWTEGYDLNFVKFHIFTSPILLSLSLSQNGHCEAFPISLLFFFFPFFFIRQLAVCK